MSTTFRGITLSLPTYKTVRPCAACGSGRETVLVGFSRVEPYTPVYLCAAHLAAWESAQEAIHAK